MKYTTEVAVLGLVLLLGLAGGWSLHARRFSKAQTQWVEAVKDAHVRTDIALRVAADQKAQADSLRTLARLEAAEADAGAEAQRRLRAVSLQARDALTQARSMGDSLRAAIGVVVAVEAERDTALAQGDRWRRAYQTEFRAANVLALRGDSLEAVVRRQDSLLVRGTKVVGSSGCRIPLIGVKCPGVMVGYGYTADLSGEAVTLQRGVAVTVGWRVL